jgi:hypothetical protein
LIDVVLLPWSLLLLRGEATVMMEILMMRMMNFTTAVDTFVVSQSVQSMPSYVHVKVFAPYGSGVRGWMMRGIILVSIGNGRGVVIIRNNSIEVVLTMIMMKMIMMKENNNDHTRYVEIVKSARATNGATTTMIMVTPITQMGWQTTMIK